MSPTAAERDALFQAFARALFRNDMDAMYQVVTENFVWRCHDGLSTERVLTGRDAIAAHIAERKAFFSTSRFHDVVYRHLPGWRDAVRFAEPGRRGSPASPRDPKDRQACSADCQANPYCGAIRGDPDVGTVLSCHVCHFALVFVAAPNSSGD